MNPSEQPHPCDTCDPRAVAYIRVASAYTADQAAGARRQRTAITAAADRLGFAVSKGFIDLGYPGRTLERPGLHRLLDAIATGWVGYCIVASFDRFSRELKQDGQLDQALSDARVTIVDASGVGRRTWL